MQQWWAQKCCFRAKVHPAITPPLFPNEVNNTQKSLPQFCKEAKQEVEGDNPPLDDYCH